MATIVDDGDDGLLGDGSTVDLARYRARRLRLRLLDLLDALIAAAERRDLQGVWDLLDEADAIRWLPAGVRQEALMLARLPVGSLRAPLRAYQYYHQLQQLGTEPLEVVADPCQLTLDLAPRAASR